MRLLLLFAFVAFSMLSVRCVSTQPPGAGLEQVVSEVLTPPPQRISLSWESKSGRESWSDEWTKLLKTNMAVYSKAGDLKRICPRWTSLSEADKLKALGEFWVAVAYYESGFNPASQAVDVGTKENKDSWSIGLYQVSVRDNANKQGPKYSFNELITAIPNIVVANEIMVRQVRNHGLMILPNSSKGRYWAVILDGNKYSKVSEIIARTQKNASFCK